MRKFLTLLLFIFLTLSSYSANEYSRAELISLAKQIDFLDSNSVQFPNSLWNDLVNVEVRTFTELCSCVTDTKTVTLSANTGLYALPTNFANPISVFSSNRGKNLERIEPQDRGLLPYTDTIDAEYYYVFNQTIGFDTVPGRADTVFIIYLKEAKILSYDDTVTNIPSEFSEALVRMIASDALERLKLHDQATYQYEKAIDIMNRVKLRKQFTPQQIRTTKVVQPR